jgi:hypothetical protein
VANIVNITADTISTASTIRPNVQSIHRMADRD